MWYFGFLFPKNLAYSSDEELSKFVAVFVESYKDDISDDLLSQVLAFRPKNTNKELIDTIIELNLLFSFPDLVIAIVAFLTLFIPVA